MNHTTTDEKARKQDSRKESPCSMKASGEFQELFPLKGNPPSKQNERISNLD